MSQEFHVVFVVSGKGRWSQRQFRDLGKSDQPKCELAGWERRARALKAKLGCFEELVLIWGIVEQRKDYKQDSESSENVKNDKKNIVVVRAGRSVSTKCPPNIRCHSSSRGAILYLSGDSLWGSLERMQIFHLLFSTRRMEFSVYEPEGKVYSQNEVKFQVWKQSFYVSSAQRPRGREFEDHWRNDQKEEQLWGLKWGKLRSEEAQRDSMSSDAHVILECRLMLPTSFSPLQLSSGLCTFGNIVHT